MRIFALILAVLKVKSYKCGELLHWWIWVTFFRPGYAILPQLQVSKLVRWRAMMKRFTLLRLLLVFVDLIRLLGWLFRGFSPEMYSTTKAEFFEWPPLGIFSFLIVDSINTPLHGFHALFAQQNLFLYGWEFDLRAINQETIKITTRDNIFQKQNPHKPLNRSPSILLHPIWHYTFVWIYFCRRRRVHVYICTGCLAVERGIVLLGEFVVVVDLLLQVDVLLLLLLLLFRQLHQLLVAPHLVVLEILSPHGKFGRHHVVG